MPLRYLSRRALLIKDFHSGIGKTAVIFPVAFLVCLALVTLQLGMVFYLREVYEATGSQVGAFFGVWSLCFILGCILVIPLADHIRPRYLMIAATFCMCILALGVHYGGSLVLAFVCSGLIGLSNSLFWPPMVGWVSGELEGAELSKIMSRYNLSWSSAAIISPLVAGRLSERGTVLPIYVASGLALLASFLIAGAALALPMVRNDTHSAARAMDAGANAGIGTLLRYSAWVGVFTACAVLGVVAVIFPLSARVDLHISKSVIGTLMLSRMLFMTLGFWIMGRTAFWHCRSSPMLLGQTCIAGCLVAMIYACRPLTLSPVLVFLGLLTALSYSSSQFHGMLGTANRAARNAVHESLLSGGMISGFVLGGIIYDHYSIAAVYTFCATLVLAGVVVQAGIALWSRAKDNHPN